MKSILKRNITITESIFIIANLIPLIGVWFLGWKPSEIFIIYCFESLIMGLMTVIKLLITTFYKKKDEWENNGTKSMVSGYFFILFFMFHFGFFVFVQMTIFLSITNIEGLRGRPLSFFSLLFNPAKYISPIGMILLLIFFVSYGIAMIKDFIIPEKYKTVPMDVIMFSPYGRIFVQQFVVILGSFFLMMNASKLFILIFILVKIFFETFINFTQLSLTKTNSN